MPIFEYHCSRCNKDFEELVLGGGGQTGVKCPACGSKKVKRALSVFGLGGMKSGGNGGGFSAAGGSGSSCGSCHGGSCSTCK